MIYPLLHKLFGWDYIIWSNSCDQGISRIRKLPDGTIWYWQYKITRVAVTFPTHHRVIWLTCKPEKYFK